LRRRRRGGRGGGKGTVDRRLREREQRHPGPGRGDAQLPLRAQPDACRGRDAPARARRARDRRPPAFARGAGGAPVSPGRAPSRDRRVRGAAQAGLDECRRLRGARPRRDQPRAGRHPLRAHAGGAGRDRGARADVRGPEALPDRLMTLSPLLAELEQYPFARLDDWRADARRRGIEVIDFGVGDPREATPELVREALAAGVPEVSSYPRAVGLPAYREAVAAWIGRRFGVDVDPAAEVVPTLGSKEAIFSFAQTAVSS